MLDKIMLKLDDEIEPGVTEHTYTKGEKVEFVIAAVTMIILTIVQAGLFLYCR
jgi:hypothetical protein